ncbi:hypothetical protein [Streptomyces malaysiensis]|uniref:hypothetical protein n=1 Tax=Streptomyces malaysiensis TaxID=92644 RepID=UPI00114CC20F|nr:hypothetical protein [Streptomyces sp. SPMA113]
MQSLTIGGLFVGLAIPTFYVARWTMEAVKKKTFPEWQQPVGLVAGLAYGGIAAMCTGGLIGFSTGAITLLGNGAGSLAMWGMTGGHTTLDARTTEVTLTGEGNLVLLLLTVTLIGAWKGMPSKMRGLAKKGVVAGVLLGLSATLGGVVAASLIPAINDLGAQIVGSVA